jgi:hypothetical protein
MKVGSFIIMIINLLAKSIKNDKKKKTSKIIIKKIIIKKIK